MHCVARLEVGEPAVEVAAAGGWAHYGFWGRDFVAGGGGRREGEGGGGEEGEGEVDD